MKFLLAALNSKFIHTNLAVYSLKSYAGELALHVEIGEYTINHNADFILQDIYERKPDVIGFSCYIWNYEYIKLLAENLAKVLPEVPIWLGGPEVSYDAEKELSSFPHLKGIMMGEGEEIFRKLLSHYVENTPELREIPGLCYREKDEIFCNPAAEILEMSQIPFPYQDGDDFSHKIVYYESSRGCPFACSYCLSSLDKRLRFRSMDLIKKELSFFLAKRVPQVKFVDRTFNCKKEHCMEIWKFLLEHDNGVTNFHFEIAADLITQEELSLLKQMRPGLIQLEIGVQSVNPDTLLAIRRKMDFQKVKEVVGKIRSFHNIHQHLDLIAGLPCEDYESFGRSFDAVYSLKPSQLQLGFLKVLKGSYMYDQTQRYGLVYQSVPPYEVLSTNWLSYGDIIHLKKIEEMVETYYNSGQYLSQIAYLERFFASPFSMYEALARFFEEGKEAGSSLSRAEICRKLYEFGCLLCPEEEAVFRMLAAYDMYSRENCKSRPDFLASQEPYKQEISDFLAKEGREHRIFPSCQGEAYRSFLHHIHGEAFTIEIEPLIDKGKKVQGLWYYLFDYHDRDPLTYNARVRKIPVM